MVRMARSSTRMLMVEGVVKMMGRMGVMRAVVKPQNPRVVGLSLSQSFRS